MIVDVHGCQLMSFGSRWRVFAADDDGMMAPTGQSATTLVAAILMVMERGGRRVSVREAMEEAARIRCEEGSHAPAVR